MRVTELQRVLQITSRVAAPSADIPALSSTFFNGVEARAFNDTLCVMEPCSLPLNGGYDSKFLFAWSKGVRRDDFTVSEDGDSSLKFNGGLSRMSLTRLPMREFPFVEPTDDPDIVYDCDAFHAALLDCSLYLGFEQDELWRSGVSVSGQGSVVALYATNNIAVVRRVVPKLQLPVDGARIIPAPLVDYLSKVEIGEIECFELGEGWVRAVFRSGGWAWCASPVDADPDKIDDVLVSAFDGAELVGIPDDFVTALQDVVSIGRVAGTDEVSLTFLADRVMVSVESLSVAHSVAVLLDNSFDTQVTAPGSVLLSMLKGCNQMGVTESAIVATAKHFNGAVALMTDD